MFYKFSEHAIIQDLNFHAYEQLRFWTFSIPIHVLNFDLRANLTRTYGEKKNTCCTFGLLKDIFYEIRWEKNTL